MSAEVIFWINLVLRYSAWLLCFSLYDYSSLKASPPFKAHRAMPMLHSFRFIGVVFILPGVAGHLPKAFADFDAYVDLSAAVLELLALVA